MYTKIVRKLFLTDFIEIIRNEIRHIHNAVMPFWKLAGISLYSHKNFQQVLGQFYLSAIWEDL
jgi:hypothetical protein